MKINDVTVSAEEMKIIKAVGFRKPKTLPKTLSKLIEVAINDMKEIERINALAEKARLAIPYRFDMGEWHASAIVRDTSDSLDAPEHLLRYRSPGIAPCSVCFAGSVMARSLGTAITEDSSEWDSETAEGRHNNRCFSALNDVRCGMIVNAALTMYEPLRRLYDSGKVKRIQDEFLDRFPVDHLNSRRVLATKEGRREFWKAMMWVSKKLARINL